MKGLQHIPTRHRSASRTMPSSREQALAELTYLEHESARLERRLKILNCQRLQVEARLRQGQERIALLGRLLYQAEAHGQPAAADPEFGGGQDNSATWREVQLEY